MKVAHQLRCLLVVVTAAAALRFYRLDHAILTLDEASSWRVATRSPQDVLLHCAANVHPPAHFLLLKVWMHAAGSSPLALRSLSALLGALGVALMYLLLVEVQRPTSTSSRRLGCLNFSATRSIRVAALFGAAAIAFAPLQVQIARTARMYSLGTLLAALSGWLLWRALRAKGPGWGRWAAWGGSLSLLCYTHNYGLFSVAAQILFLAGHWLACMLGPVCSKAPCAAREVDRRSELRPGYRHCFPAGLALAIAISLYSPWMAVLQAQSEEVRAGYWIPPLEWTETCEIFFTWLTGLEYSPTPARWVCALAALAAAASTVWRRDRAGLFFLSQAAFPWLAALLWSYFAGTSILQLRYFAFAQVGLFGLYSIGLAHLLEAACPYNPQASREVFGSEQNTAVLSPAASSTYSQPAKVSSNSALVASACAAAIFLVPLLYDSVLRVAKVQPTAASIQAATETIARHPQRRAIVLVSRPGEVNRVRYYLHGAGIDDVPVLCRVNLFNQGKHIPHLGSLITDDLLFEEWPAGLRACWRLAFTGEQAPPAPSHMPARWTQVFSAPVSFQLSLHEPAP